MKVSSGARIASMRRQMEQLYVKLHAMEHRADVWAARTTQMFDSLKDIRDRPVDQFVDYRTEIDKIIEGHTTMFTQQHYIAVAKIIKHQREKLSDDFPDSAPKHEQINELQLAFIKKFEADNPKFNKLIFIGACGEQPEPSESE